MSTRTYILALATVAAFGAAAVAPTGASAKPMGVIVKKPIGIPGLKVMPGPLPVKPGPIVGLPVKPKPPILGIVIHPPHDHDHDHDHDWDHDHDHFRWWHRPPVVIEEGGAPIVSRPIASTPSSPAPCNCLTKTYLQDGGVLFQDVCTKEAAIATPAGQQAQQGQQ